MMCQYGRCDAITTLVEAKASIDQRTNLGTSPIAISSIHSHNAAVRLLAHLGARLHEGSGRGFWLAYKEAGVLTQETIDKWEWIVSKGGDIGEDETSQSSPITEASLKERIKRMKQCGWTDPRKQ